MSHVNPPWICGEHYQRRGVLLDTDEYNPVDYFDLFFPNEVYELMATETNRYADQFRAYNPDRGQHSRFNAWEETNISEMKAYVALQIAMGLCQKHELADYWEKYWLTSLNFSDVMSKNKIFSFEFIYTFC